MKDDVMQWAIGLEEMLGVSPEPIALFLEAFTHPSYANEQPPPRPPDHQRLEFVGDAVIGLVVARELWRRFPSWREGDLARTRTALVNTRTLADRARALRLDRWLRLGRGERKSGGMDRDSTLCDAFEALTGALFIARGWAAAEAFVLRELENWLRRVAKEDAPGLDAKTRLQEMLHQRGPGFPRYVVVDATGPDHRRTFVVDVHWQGTRIGRGSGLSKRAAEQAAAEDALSSLGSGGAPPDSP